VNTQTSLLTGLGLGLGLSYFLDAGRGARRRAHVRDTMAHSAAVTRRALGRTGRDALHRTAGTIATARHVVRRREQVDDLVLIERVRAKLGRHVSHPHAVRVTAADGMVTLSGPILEREVEALLAAVRRVRGVRGVTDRLDIHEQARHVPALQGGRAPAGDHLDLFQEHWAPTTRLLVGAAGGMLVAAGATRRDVRGALAALLGLGLVARAAANVPANRLTGVGSRRRAVDVQKTITINAPVSDVFAFWSMFENFPQFTSRVLEVRQSRDVNRSHWRVWGPAGVPVDFDAEITRTVPDKLIAWRTVDGSPVAHAGIVRFDSISHDVTRVHIRMSYNPPAGWLGHGVAKAFGVDPKHSMDEDLVRMKTLIETGHPPRDAADRRLVSQHG
jgi:uncharacterized membrane protein